VSKPADINFLAIEFTAASFEAVNAKWSIPIRNSLKPVALKEIE
jgi:hypothetical protein